MAPCRTLLGLLLLSAVQAAPQVQATGSTVTAVIQPSATPIISETGSTLTNEEQDDLFSLHEELVNIPSISGEETECADFVAEYLEELGYYVEQIPVGDTGTSNVFAYPQELKDQGVWPEVLITSHIDTVSTQQASSLFSEY